METQQVPAEGSLGRFKEKLKKVLDDAATISVMGQSPPNRKETNRRRRSSPEDPIRTVMFLGSWSHT
ncbi:hypothetical protein MRB53_031716 [Persea americana]|uniref:Uncharacterized protein n=1 Tax=Persea americana TaxID=3435 RepID=A0ACC2KPW4_PERAE|nr:hypothetical protein MRB53_031716 [Persea americana]